MRNLFHFAKVRLDREVKGGDMDIQFDTMWFALYTLGQLVAFGSGYLLFQAGAITVGTVYLIVYYTDRILRTHCSTEMRAAVPGTCERRWPGASCRESVCRSADNRRRRASRRLPGWSADGHFDGVSFRYSADEPVVYATSAFFAPGRVLGLRGAPAAARRPSPVCLFRLYEPTAGLISLGNGQPHALGEYQLARGLRSPIGLVTQEVQLFVMHGPRQPDPL